MSIFLGIKKSQVLPDARHGIIRLALAVALGGVLAVHPGPAQAQMINPFGVNNGLSLTKQDYQLGGAAVKKLLNDDTPAVGRYETWSNPASGNHGKLTILDVFTSKDLPCRKIESAVVYGKKGAAPGSKILDACKVASGEWKIAP